LSFSQDSAPEEKEKAVSLAKKSINQAINEIRSLQTSMGYLESPSMTEQIDIVDFIRSNEKVISMDYMADIFFEYYTADKIIRINPLTLLQVLNLLIKNSVDYADSPDLKIVISVDFEEPETLLISVEDNGKGIPEEHKEKIFEPFFTTSGISRLGLGLSIARKIVREQFYGFLKYDETFTDGARFVIGIPVEVFPYKLRQSL
jgi:signal transduction histidine kinase